MDRRNVLKMGVGGAAAWSGLSSSVASAQGAPIKLGMVTSLTGAAGPGGQPMLLGAQIAVDQVNQAGGVNGRKLELLVRDDKSRPSDATVAARELMGSGVNLLFGVVSSAVALGINAMLMQEKSLLITCAAHSEKLTKELFVPNYFRVTDNPYMRQRALATMALSRFQDIRRWGGVIPDHEYGRTSWECFQDAMLTVNGARKGQPVSFAGPVSVPFGAPDFRNGVTAAMGLPADGFLVVVYGSDAVTFYKQAEPFGLFKKAKAIIDPSNELIVPKAMKQETPDMWIGAHWLAKAFEDVPTSRALHAEAVRRTGDPLTQGFLSEGHAGVMAYAKAIQAAGKTDTDAVRSALEAVTFDTATGPRRFRKEDHQAIKPVVIYRARGSAKVSEGFEILETVRVPGEDVIEPATPGKALRLRTV